MKINENERIVLRILTNGHDSYFNGFCCFNFNNILQKAQKEGFTLSRKEIRRACRSLKRKGLAAFHIGLWYEDGPAGAGYCATGKGVICRFLGVNS